MKENSNKITTLHEEDVLLEQMEI